MIIDLNEKCKTVKTSRRNIGQNQCDFEFGDEFLDKTSKEQSMKENIDQLDCIKKKNLCSVKDTIKRIQGQSAE